MCTMQKVCLHIQVVEWVVHKLQVFEEWSSEVLSDGVLSYNTDWSFKKFSKLPNHHIKSDLFIPYRLIPYQNLTINMNSFPKI